MAYSTKNCVTFSNAFFCLNFLFFSGKNKFHIFSFVIQPIHCSTEVHDGESALHHALLCVIYFDNF